MHSFRRMPGCSFLGKIFKVVCDKRRRAVYIFELFVRSLFICSGTTVVSRLADCAVLFPRTAVGRGGGQPEENAADGAGHSQRDLQRCQCQDT